MKKTVLLTFVLLMVFAGIGVLAQDEEVPEECQKAEMANVLYDAAESFDEGEKTLDEVIDVLLKLRAGCDDLAWDSETEGMQPVIGPVTLPEGLYRFSVETDGYLIAELEAIDGDCESKGFMGLFNLMQGQGNGADQLVESSGCEALITIGNTTKAWTMTAEKLK